MKSKFSLLYLFLLSSMLFACNSPENDVKATFVGIIEEVHEESATVSVIEADGIYKISGLVNINLSVNPEESFQVGDKVKVGYDGTTMETSPLGIKTLTLEKVE
ncbi:ABC-type sugar transport system, ATPase component [Solibacillus silvestris StLB046]|uniref:ABC-type sugar transport system, ATPase component n=1 Tax=Solibacillus silvestris (strain StLB046) TaxID=1002809 RepID=F2FAH7_SOLSS|nr:hypothetical protein [Solibacillus silvestris]BAK16744.1 ABC-type sugar transport system, ATPase component [Solibacillus silvestris StLB046]